MKLYSKAKPKKEDLDRIFKSVKGARKGVNVRKYAGKVKAKENPVTSQRKLRNEWD